MTQITNKGRKVPRGSLKDGRTGKAGTRNIRGPMSSVFNFVSKRGRP
jgi:hypothetical protein